MSSRCAGLALLATLFAAGCGGGGGGSDATRSYVGSTAGVVLYVTWNREGDDLNGALTEAVLNGSKQTVTTSRSSFMGKISGSGVTIDPLQSDGQNSTLTGTLDGDALRLEYLQGNDGVVTVALRQAPAAVFNSELASLRDQVDQTKADAASQAASTSEKDQVAQHAQAVRDDVDALKVAIATAPSAKGAGHAPDLAQLRRDLQTIRDDTRAVQRADHLRVCASAATVQSDLSTLEGHVTALSTTQTTRDTGSVAVSKASDKLREDYLTLQSDDSRDLPPDAPTQKTVARAIKQARRRLRTGSPPSSATTSAVNAILTEARGLNAQASTLCRAGA